MTPVARIVKTTAFKLSALYFLVFSAFAVSFVVYVIYSTNQLLTRQVGEAIETEFRGLADQWNNAGLIGIMNAIEARIRRPGASLYLLTDAAGQMIVGNISELPAAVRREALQAPVALPYQSEAGVERTAMVQVARLPGGFNLLVGRDVDERNRITGLVRQALGLAAGLMIALGAISWFYVNRRVLKRIDSISATSRQIMAGDLSGRLEVIGTDDEFDRLAGSLNAMLARIEHLLTGLKEVSDNIAHDLKTPLTRMRTRLEGALAADPQVPNRAVLERTIEEADQLIRTFNALLMIARVEAGAPDGALADVDVAAVVRDVAELYEPLAEEAGVRLTVAAPGPLPLRGNRELLSQSIANLVDDAIKYARSAPGEERQATVALSAGGDGEAVTVTVADNGPGVPEADRERVLQRFVRLEKSRSEPGSGLGLSLAAAVARLHGGTLSLADNRPGLAVTLRLPVAGTAWSAAA